MTQETIKEKEVPLNEANAYMRDQLYKRFGYKSLVELAKDLGVSASQLRNQLSKVRAQRDPSWLMKALGLEMVTYVRRAK